jgi:hypothetical protein
MTAQTFTCPYGGAITRNPRDVLYRYCPRCHVYVDDVASAVEETGGCGGLLSADARCTVIDVERALEAVRRLSGSS